MKVSYNWLSEYLNFSLDAIDLSDALTSTGLEIEGMVEVFKAFDHLVVGQVISCKPHPNADRLKITKVNVGSELKQIICGASNVKKDQLVVVVLAGNKLYNQKGESFKIKKTKIRGELSEGMICAEDEIGLGVSHNGIIELKNDCKPGDFVRDYFKINKDIILDIALTPNRTDAFGHHGVCRDLYAFLKHRGEKVKLSFPEVNDYHNNNSDLNLKLKIDESTLCPHYQGVCIENVQVKSSPQWLQSKLISIGLKPINNIVDITNFVLHETGNPLHAFDYDKIKNSNLIVRTAKTNEQFETLDAKKINLSSEDLVICDEDGPLCLAGVVGGLNSAVTHLTKNIFLESAFFNPQSIRKTSKAHSISSDSSYRFERGVDFSNCEYALKRAALLMQDICGGVIGKEVKCSSSQLCCKEVKFDYDYCEFVLGHKIENKHLVNILKDLDFKILSQNDKSCILSVPAFRVDVTRQIDVVEEVLRIYGYDNLPSANFIKFQPNIQYESSINNFKIQISNLLVSNGFCEIQNNSLIPESSLDIFPAKTKSIKLMNPLSQDLSIMRTNMFVNGLQTIRHNLNRQVNNLKIFEFGKIYSIDQEVYVETQKLTIFTCGVFKGQSWKDNSINADFFLMKGVLMKIFNQFGINLSHFSTKEFKCQYSETAIVLSYQDTCIAEIGKFSHETLSRMAIKKEVFYVDVNIDLLFNIQKKIKLEYTQIPRFPSIKRDLSLLVSKDVSYSNIQQVIKKRKSHFLKRVSLFDVYMGKGIGADKKSYSLSFLFQNNDRTLTDVEIDKEMLQIYKTLELELNVTLRDGELSNI